MLRSLQPCLLCIVSIFARIRPSWPKLGAWTILIGRLTSLKQVHIAINAATSEDFKRCAWKMRAVQELVIKNTCSPPTTSYFPILHAPELTCFKVMHIHLSDLLSASFSHHLRNVHIHHLTFAQATQQESKHTNPGPKKRRNETSSKSIELGLGAHPLVYSLCTHFTPCHEVSLRYSSSIAFSLHDPHGVDSAFDLVR